MFRWNVGIFTGHQMMRSGAFKKIKFMVRRNSKAGYAGWQKVVFKGFFYKSREWSGLIFWDSPTEHVYNFIFRRKR